MGSLESSVSFLESPDNILSTRVLVGENSNGTLASFFHEQNTSYDMALKKDSIPVLSCITTILTLFTDCAVAAPTLERRRHGTANEVAVAFLTVVVFVTIASYLVFSFVRRGRANMESTSSSTVTTILSDNDQPMPR